MKAAAASAVVQSRGTEQKNDLTPLMRQYNEIKARNPGAVLLYRMGDFYEMFNEDAKIASTVLGLTLTSRNHGGAENTPLAGFPFHALDRYVHRLIKAGYKIAVCEQTEDPKQAKGIVRRDIVEIISAGTATEGSFIEEKANNFILGICRENGRAGVALCDLSTGQFETEEVDEGIIGREIARIGPSEIVAVPDEEEYLRTLVAEAYRQTVISFFDAWKFSTDTAADALKTHFQVASLSGFGLEGFTCGVAAAGALLLYLKEQKKSDLRHITALRPRLLSEFAELDPSTIRNLELLKPLHTDEHDGTLVSVLDKTSTSMGGRMLKRMLTRPLKDAALINERLACVEWLKKDPFVRQETELLLKRVADIERLIGRITLERANGRDLVALKNSLDVFPALIRILKEAPPRIIADAVGSLSGFEHVVHRIAATLTDNPPHSIREGNIIRNGVSPELDELRDIAGSSKKWIARLQESERARCGISSLKVGFNRVFGYYIEVSNANLNLVPADYTRKQTLTNGERFVTPELKEMEGKILGAEERLSVLEYELFVELRSSVAAECVRIQKAAQAVACIDVFTSFARVAAENNYCRPIITAQPDIVIREGRHPVVEHMLHGIEFVPNDTDLIKKEAQILLITGPNMAGKSTYLRQNALIAIMAQIGSFVPAQFAQIGVVDKFYTRVGASDRLARGLSTFLVEMIEVATILNNATDSSLILLDEVGRGTSTFDGISIAWAVAEYLHETAGRRGRTIFATHYHELTEMALLFPRIRNLHVKVKEWNDQIIFLRKIDAGSCDHSYGIQVARLAGVPRKVILRAREILSNLENMELTPDHTPVLARHRNGAGKDENAGQTDLFSSGIQMNAIDSRYGEIVQQLQDLAVEELTPLDALNVLAELKEKASSTG
ncbi:MAG: DNA mismatch repair protein MutS [Chitinispirillaceae bacterium]|nr:DNA mismatch repair protein MutS [Chitinispirillaceae bacterium]